MSVTTARGRITVRRKAKDGNDGLPGKDGGYTAFVYKRSNDQPATPTGVKIPPAGWYLTPDIGREEISIDFSFSGNWHVTDNAVTIIEGDISHNEMSIEHISFTTTRKDTVISLLLTVVSEANYDWLILGDLDTSVSKTSYKKRISGNNTLELELTVSEIGEHYFEIAFSKDGSKTATGEYASLQITKVEGSPEGKVWFSQAFVTDGKAGTWSTPTPMQGADGVAGAIIRRLVWKEGEEYRNDVIDDTVAPDGNKYIDICTNKQIAFVSDTSLVVMVCQKTHTASSEIPFASGTYWKTVNPMKPIMTALILAQAISADYIDVETLAANTAFITKLFAQQITAEKMKLTSGCEINGKVNIASGRILFNTDGSGQLASGAISWDEYGNGEISNAWNNPVTDRDQILNKTFYVPSGKNITDELTFDVGFYKESDLTNSFPIKKRGSFTIINHNDKPCRIKTNGEIILSKITRGTNNIINTLANYDSFVIGSFKSMTFDVFDNLNDARRIIIPSKSYGWFNYNGTILPCTENNIDYSYISDIKKYVNPIPGTVSAGTFYKTIDLPSNLIKYMSIKLSGRLNLSYDSSLYFQKYNSSGVPSGGYSANGLTSETYIYPANTYCNILTGGSYGFGAYNISCAVATDITCYLKLYDDYDMIAYFEIIL